MSKPRRSNFRLLLSVYLGLLALSWIVQAFRDFSPGVEPGAEVALLADPETGGEVRMTYLDIGMRGADPPQPVLVLLHGSPGTLHDFRDVVPLLEQDYRLIVPSLPGFGGSRADQTDYSVRTHAGYVLQLLDQLEIERAHLLGFSMSGGVVLELAEREPERVESLTLLAAIGAQEYELFGTYGLNHTAHRAQYLALEGLRFLVPHFGAMETTALNRHYARNFLDTDQRPLRTAMENYDGPALVIHGDTDFLVPVEAAREHARLMPQAKLITWEDEGHFMLWRGVGHPERVANELQLFLRAVDQGNQPSRSEAPPERRQAAEAPFDPDTVPALEGMALILAILAIAGATLVSEDLTCIAVGIVIAEGRLSFGAGVLGCFLGIFFGDVLLYLFGRYFGRGALARRPLRWWLTPERLDAASAWFQTRGLQVIFASRFVPGFRVPTYVAAGVLHTPFLRFCLYFAVAVALWTPILVGFSAWAGKRALTFVESYSGWALPILGLLVLGIYFLQRLILPLFSWRGRRMLLGAWRRKTRFEFWPLPIFYLPVALQILRLAWK
ncbi:MAG: alpha/beta fold hydrolase, partial [Planctomycetota bacterium]